MRNKKVKFIRRASFFKDWSFSEQENFLSYSSDIFLKEGDFLFRSGEKAERFFLLISGLIDITNNSGAEVAEFVEGEFFGEFEFMTHALYDASAMASSDSILLTFPKEGKTILDFSKEFPVLYAKLIRSFLIFVSHRTRNAGRLLKENSPITKQLKKQLYGDTLTGVFNRTFLQENTKELFVNTTSLIMFKPDNFKAINDTFGHEAGDTVLIFIGKLLHQTFSDHSTIVRYDGNEFAIITSNTNKPDSINFALQIQELIEGIKLSEVLNKPNEVGFSISISCGLALFPLDGNDPLQLINECAKLPLVGRNRGGHALILLEEFLQEETI
ncbi:MAG: GGDEF domain-containing protein [Spirochaetaceae bacterium]|nr:GGDEF domain-containing protein [Spirochaetaceae bacterium]